MSTTLPPLRHAFLLVGIATVLFVSGAFFSSSLRALTAIGEVRAVAPRRRNNAILFVHFHKSGGTTVCSTFLQSSRVPLTDVNGNKRRPVRNCNVESSGPRNDVDLYGGLQTCRILELYGVDLATGEKFGRNNLVAVETPLMEPLPCRGFRSFAVMRRPVSRLLSHMPYHRLAPEDYIRYMNDPKGERMTERERGMTGRHVYVGYPIVNCFVIRMLLGRERYQDPRPVDATDLALAKRQVDDFDAFVPLEHLLHDNVLTLLKETVPEYHEGLIEHPHRQEKKARKRKGDDDGDEEDGEGREDGGDEGGGEGEKAKGKGKLKADDPDFLKRLHEENEYDTMLYEYVLEKLGIVEEEKEE